jgi:hypothetical protein
MGEDGMRVSYDRDVVTVTEPGVEVRRDGELVALQVIGPLARGGIVLRMTQDEARTLAGMLLRCA